MAVFLPQLSQTPDDREVVLAPPFTAISTMADLAKGSRLALASQNVHWEASGAFTAEISPAMLKEHEVVYTIVGHSEPRKYFSESDEQINLRARSAQDNGLIPIVCVGESDEQRERGEAERVIRRQIEQGLEHLDPEKLVMAYEPIWAIGTGKTCASEEANRLRLDPQLGRCSGSGHSVRRIGETRQHRRADGHERHRRRPCRWCLTGSRELRAHR